MAKANEQSLAKPFTLKERTFIAAYVKTKNATKAAIEAGYSERSAHVYGSTLFNDPRIKGEIERRIEALIDRYDASAANIVRELASIAFSSVGDLIAIQDDGSAIVDLSTATKRQLSALGGIEVDERFEQGDEDRPGARTVKTKLKHSIADKRQALMDLAKLQRLLPADRLEHSGSVEHVVKQEHMIDIESMSLEQREQLRSLLLSARRGQVTDVEDESE